MEHVYTNAVQAAEDGHHPIPLPNQETGTAVSNSAPQTDVLSARDLQWLLAAAGAIFAVILGLRYIAPGFLFGLVAGLVLVIGGQVATVWFLWERVREKKEDSHEEPKKEATTSEDGTTVPSLERQASVSNEGCVWIATKPAPSEWPKSAQRGGRGPLSPPGWAPQKRQAKLHFNMLMLGGADGEKAIIKLDGCDVRAVSANGAPERKWSKKFPISIQHPERTLFSNSRELLIYCASGFEKESWCNSLRHAARLHAPENPSALRMREDYATFIDLVRQMAEGGEEWLVSDPHEKETGNSSGLGKWRAKLRRRSKGRIASFGSAEEAAGGAAVSPGARPSSPPRKGESDNEDNGKTEESASRLGHHSKVRSLLAGRKLFRRKKAAQDVGERSHGSSMGESVVSEDDVSDAGGVLSGDEFSAGEDSGRKSVAGDVLSTGGGDEGEDAVDGKVEGENIIRFGRKAGGQREAEHAGAPDGGIRFCNVMFARFFFDMARNSQVAEMIKGRIERKLARVETPSFMGSLKCTHFDLGTRPPLARAMRVLPSSQTLSGVTVEVDFEYRGSAKLTFETRLDMRAYANTGLFKNLNDKPGGVAEKTEELAENVELVAAGLATKGLEPAGEALETLKEPGKAPGRRLKGNFHSAVTGVLARLKPVVQHVTEQVSMVPLTLTVTVLGLEGTARLRLGPPPTDRLWFGFSEMPDLELESRPSVGQLNITRNPLAAWMVERLRNLLRDSLVAPQSEDITIPYMMTDPDNLYHGDPPPAWKRSPSDMAPGVGASLAGSPKPASPGISSPSGGSVGAPWGLAGTPPKWGVAQTPGALAVTGPHSTNVAPILSPVPFAGFPKTPASVTPPAEGWAPIPVPRPHAPETSPVATARVDHVTGTVDTSPVEQWVGTDTQLQRTSDIPGQAFETASTVSLRGPSALSVGSSQSHVPSPELPGREAGLGTSLPNSSSASSAWHNPPEESAEVTGGAQKGSIRDLTNGGGIAWDVGAGGGFNRSAGEEQPAGLGNLQGFVGEDGQGGLPRSNASLGTPSSLAQEAGSPLAVIGEDTAVVGSGGELRGGEEVRSVPGGSAFESTSQAGGPRTESEAGLETGSMNVGPTEGVDSSLQTGVRDPFPPIALNVPPSNAAAHSAPRDPSDPWDLVAHRANPFPKPAAPEAFRNRSPEQPGGLLPVGSASSPNQQGLPSPAPALTNNRLEGLLDEHEGSSGSERSIGSFDSGSDAAGGGLDGGVGHRKAMVLDYGKKIGASFRERGRKYLEKGRLGSLLNRADGAGPEGHSQQHN